jgi:hypothetical protein
MLLTPRETTSEPMVRRGAPGFTVIGISLFAGVTTKPDASGVTKTPPMVTTPTRVGGAV